MCKLIIVGAGGFGREVLWLAREVNRVKQTYEILGFLDDNQSRHGLSLNGIPVLGGIEQAGVYAQRSDVEFVVAVGEPDVRKAIVDRLAPLGLRYATLVDPQARGDWERISIGEGSIICAGVVLTTNISLGRHVILNLMVNVGHDTAVGDFTTIAPNSTISGSVSLGEGDYLGSSCTIRDEMTVGEWSIVGMGAVVTKPVPPGVVVAGVPAQIIRENTNRRVWR